MDDWIIPSETRALQRSSGQRPWKCFRVRIRTEDTTGLGSALVGPINVLYIIRFPNNGESLLDFLFQNRV